MNIPESEYIERSAFEDLHAAADATDANEIGLNSYTTGSSFVSVASHLPASAIVINRSLGLGLDNQSTAEEIDSILSLYKEKEIKRYFIQVHPQATPININTWLLDAGMMLGRGWQKFSRGRNSIPSIKSDLLVKEIGSENGTEFAEIVCNAFDIGKNAVGWFSKLPSRPNWHVFMSFCNGEPAGVGALYEKDGFGWTDFGATAPEHRRKGSQGLLMHARLMRAFDLGCEKVFTCTGVNMPGDPQHSYSNILRAGFKEDYVRQNYEPDKMG